MSIIHDEKHPLPSARHELSFNSSSRSTSNGNAPTLVETAQELEATIAPNEGDSKRRRVLVCVDPTDGGASTDALNWAVDNLIKDGDILTLLHVVDEAALTDMFYEDMVASKSNVREEIVADAMKTAQQFVDKNTESRLDKFKINVFVEVKVGDAREIIVDTAKQLNAAAVVMGSRGRNAIARFVLGSVSDYVTQYCPAPVVVIRSGPMPLAKLAAK